MTSLIRYGDPRLPERFWERCQPVPVTGCWLWLGWSTGKGHGNFSIGGATQKAHRVAYEAFVGTIPEGAHLDHKCRARCCVNPLHLEPVTSMVNTLRGIGPTALNATRTHCVNGHELSGDNLKIRIRDGRVRRVCRTCRRERKRKAS